VAGYERGSGEGPERYRGCRGTIMMAKTVDSYRFLYGNEKRVLKRWASLSGNFI